MRFITIAIVVVVALLASLLLPVRADAHCDTMDGPVAQAGLRALETGELEPVLRWVSAQQESELQHVFETVRAIRSQDDAVREVADMYFLETLIRLHRASEGAPFTGLKPSGTPIAPAVHHAEEALASGSGSDLMTYLSQRIQSGLEVRLHRALDAARNADDSVERGREWVEAYVDFVHYVEAIDVAATGKGGHAHDEQAEDHHEADPSHADHCPAG